MKKARILLLLVLSLVAVLAFVGCSCDSEGGCEHEWDDGVVQKEATCLEKGEKLYTCEDCGETKVEKYEGTHNYEKTEEVEATCTIDGSTTYTCKTCKDSYTDVTVRAQGHSTEGCTWTTKEQSNGGCSMLHVESANCKKCNEAVEHIFFYEKHDFSVSITTAATCKTDGVKTYDCKNCDYVETETFKDAKAHTYGEGVVNASVTTYTCSGCAATKKVVSALGSNEATVPSDALQSAGGVELENATIEFDKGTLDQLNGKDVTISAGVVNTSVDEIAPNLSEDEKEKLSGATIYDFTISDGENSYISEFNGKLTITLPYELSEGQDPNAIAVWYIKEDGKPETISATYTEINGDGYAVFETDHFSYYSVIRMSDEERCAAYGHSFNSTVEPASCNKEGYTIDVCKYCRYIKPRYNFTAALTHNYAEKVVAPTCNEMGYTRYTCSNCNDFYDNSFKAKLAHNYKDEVVAPTCNSIGYTYHKCVNAGCTVSYIDSETNIVAHNYVEGKCSMCGKAQDASTNALLSAINSLATADSYSITADGFTASATNGSLKYTVTCKNLNADVKVTADNYLEGAGTCIVTLEAEEKGEVETITTTAKVIFANRNIYTYCALEGEHIDVDYDYSYNGSYDYGYGYIGEGGPIYDNNKNDGLISTPPTEILDDMTMMVPQDFILNAPTAEMPEGVDQELIDKATEKLLSVWKDVVNLKDSAIEKTLVRMVEFIFTKSTVNGTNVYTFNPTFAKTLFNDLKEMKLNKIVDYVFGDGTYDSLVKFAKELPAMKLSELKPKAEAELGKYGIDTEFIYASIKELFEMDVNEKFNSLEFKDMTLIELYNGMKRDDKTVEDFNELIDTYDQKAKEETIVSVIVQQGFDQEEVDEVINTINTTIDEVIAALGKVAIKFTITPDGTFLSSEIKLNNFSYEFTQNKQEYTVTANGSFTYKINTKVEAPTQSELFDKSDIAAEALRPSKTVVTDEFSIIVSNGKIYAVKNDLFSSIKNPAIFDQMFGSNATTEVYNGVECTKITSMPIETFYVIDNDTITYTAESCTGWYQIDFEAKRYSYYYYYDEDPILATVWIDKDGRVQNLEITSDLTDRNHGNSGFKFYYSPATKEYSSEANHDFYLSKTIQPKGCVYGKHVYKCKACGVEYESQFGKGHTWEYIATLEKGAKSCEDGVTILEKCKDCGIEGYARTVTWHYTIEKRIKIPGNTECGDIYLVYNECACGECSYFEGTISDHAIYNYNWEYDDNNREWRVYRCAICGFEYKFDSESEYKYYPNREETCWRVEIDTVVINGQTYTYTDQTYADHDTRHSVDENGYDTWTCVLCGKVTSKTKSVRDDYGREIFYHDALTDYGYTTVFTGCNYVITYRDGSTDTGVQHVGYTKTITERTCSQYGVYLWCCSLCDAVLGEYSYDGPYYSWYGGYNNHSWTGNYDDNGNFIGYRCERCGTESSYGADGKITLEDMTDEGEFKVGFNNNNVYDMTSEIDINIIFNIDADGNGIQLENSESYFQIEDTSATGYYDYNGRNSGIITVDLDMLNEAISSRDDVETVSLVVWVLTESQTQTNEDGSPAMFWMAHALTFTLDELAQIGK